MDGVQRGPFSKKSDWFQICLVFSAGTCLARTPGREERDPKLLNNSVTVCSKSLNPIYILIYYIEWFKTSWTNNTL